METSSTPTTHASPNDRWVIAGPFTAIRDRDELLDDLEEAVEGGAPAVVLVLFGFEQLKKRLETMLEPDGNLLLAKIAMRLWASTGTASVLYESRRGEFCGLFAGRAKTVAPLVRRITADLDRELRALAIQTAVGIVALPHEASDPIAALELADQRCRKLAGDLRPSPRRSVYSRIADALLASLDSVDDTAG